MACGPGATKGDAPHTLTFAVRGDVTGFFPNPPMVNEAFTVEVNRSVFETLVVLDHELRPRPGLAERWDNPDAYTYRFVLRAGVRFSDGRPLTARDVAASLEASVRHAWPTSDYLQAVDSVQAIDDRRLEIRTRTPYLTLLTRLAWAFVVPADVVDRSPVPALGSGPYRVERHEAGRVLELVRNPFYAGPPAAFERVRYLVEPDDARRVELVLRGEAAAADQFPTSLAAAPAGREDVALVRRAGPRVLFLCLRADRPPFDDPRVREAVDLALDRHELVRRALDGQAQVATQLVPQAIVGFDPRARPARVDRQAARALLEAAGVTARRLRLDGPNNRYVNDTRVLDELARQLREVGFAVEVNALPKEAFFRLIESDESPVHLLGFSCESGDAGDLLNSVLHSRTGGPLGSFNTVGLSDAELDRRIEQADSARDLGERIALLQAALSHAAALRVALPLHVQTEAVLVSTRLRWQQPHSMALRGEHFAPR
jgi:peptide/nickel transport system substrate-binding protein